MIPYQQGIEPDLTVSQLSLGNRKQDPSAQKSEKELKKKKGEKSDVVKCQRASYVIHPQNKEHTYTTDKRANESYIKFIESRFFIQRLVAANNKINDHPGKWH
jgi:hypothetical protein